MTRWSAALAVWVAAAGVAAPALAQSDRPERPYRGLFASGLEPAEHTLVANGSLGGGWDNNVVAAALFGEQIRPGLLSSTYKGGVAHASGSLSYSLNLDVISLSANAGSTLRYVPSLSSPYVRREMAGLVTAVRVTPEITVNASTRYAPHSLSSLFPELAPARETGELADIDFASSLDHYFSYQVGGGYMRRMTRKTTFSASYGYRWREATPTRVEDYTDHHIQAGLTHQVDEGLSLRLGYGYHRADRTASGITVSNHHIDAGIDYRRSLSFSRRTTLSFGTGTAMVSRPNPDNSRTNVHVTGSVTLTHELARTWHAEAAYSRNVRFDDSWGDLVSSDGVSAAFGGLISRRLSFQSSARTSLGTIGTGRSRGYRGTYGNAALGYHVGRHVSLSLTYAYYRHRLDREIALPVDFTTQSNRHSVRASVNLWAPLLQYPRSR